MLHGGPTLAEDLDGPGESRQNLPPVLEEVLTCHPSAPLIQMKWQKTLAENNYMGLIRTDLETVITNDRHG